MLMSYLWVATIAIFPVTLLYPFFKALCLKNSTTPLRCSPNEISSQKEVIFLPYELLKHYGFPSFLFTLTFLYSQFSLHQFITCTISSIWQNWSLLPSLTTFFTRLTLKVLSCFSFYLNGQSLVSLASSQLLQI